MKNFIKLSVVLNVLMFLSILFLSYKFNIVNLVVDKIGGGEVGYDVTELAHYQEYTARYKMRPNNEGEIIFLGDSLTEYSYFEEIFVEELVINRGIGSDTTDGILNRLEEVIESNPEKIFLMIGINDIGNGLSTEEIVENYISILDYIYANSPITQIYIQSVLPCNSDLMEDNLRNANRTATNITDLNDALISLANDRRCVYLDYYSYFLDDNNQMAEVFTEDGVHLTQEGYTLWGELVSEYVYE